MSFSKSTILETVKVLDYTAPLSTIVSSNCELRFLSHVLYLRSDRTNVSFSLKLCDATWRESVLVATQDDSQVAVVLDAAKNTLKIVTTTAPLRCITFDPSFGEALKKFTDEKS